MGKAKSQQSRALFLTCELTGLTFLIGRVWKDEGLGERKYNYELFFDCDSGVFESLSTLLKSPREGRLSGAEPHCAYYNTTVKKSQLCQ